MWAPPVDSADEDSDWEENIAVPDNETLRRREVEEILGGENKNEWRFHEIKKRKERREVMRRQEVYLDSDKDRKVARTHDERERYVALKEEQRVLGEEKISTAEATHSQEIFMRRTNQFFITDQNVKLVTTGVTNMIQKHNVFKPLVHDLERRIQVLRDVLNTGEAKAIDVQKPAVDLVVEELGLDRYPPSILECRACKRKCVAELRAYHESICDGHGPTKDGRNITFIAPKEDTDMNEENDNQNASESKMEKMEICPVCSKKYTKTIMDKHFEVCLRRFNFRLKAQKKNETPIEGCSSPNQPTNFSVGTPTHNSITIRWVYF
jgi:hypothetical protein